MNDVILKIINERTPSQFESVVNAILSQGGWRIAETEMSVTDSHYWAMLVKSDQAENISQGGSGL